MSTNVTNSLTSGIERHVETSEYMTSQIAQNLLLNFSFYKVPTGTVDLLCY